MCPLEPDLGCQEVAAGVLCLLLSLGSGALLVHSKSYFSGWIARGRYEPGPPDAG